MNMFKFWKKKKKNSYPLSTVSDVYSENGVCLLFSHFKACAVWEKHRTVQQENKLLSQLMWTDVLWNKDWWVGKNVCCKWNDLLNVPEERNDKKQKTQLHSLERFFFCGEEDSPVSFLTATYFFPCHRHISCLPSLHHHRFPFSIFLPPIFPSSLYIPLLFVFWFLILFSL